MNAADGDFERAMLAVLPALRGFARILTRGGAEADDLVQDTVLRMWQARKRFEWGTNLRAWAFTILRNRFYNAFIPRHRMTAIDEVSEESLAVPAMQERRSEGADIRRAILALDLRSREVLAVTAGAGLDYHDAAQVIGCPVGTIKSRAFRAPKELRRLLNSAEQDGVREHEPFAAQPDAGSLPSKPRPSRVLIVEDEYMTARELKHAAQSAGGAVVDACPTVQQGMDIGVRMGPGDLAILDIVLPDGAVYPLADALLSKGTRVIFVTGLPQDIIPDCYRAVPCFTKPIRRSLIRDIVNWRHVAWQ